MFVPIAVSFGRGWTIRDPPPAVLFRLDDPLWALVWELLGWGQTLERACCLGGRSSERDGSSLIGLITQ